MNRKIKNIFSYLWLSFMVAVPFSATGQNQIVLTREQAVDILVAELGLEDGTNAWSPFQDYGYGSDYEGILPPGTTIRPRYLNTPPYMGNTVTLTSPAYFFWVDDTPNGGYGHDVRFVYMDATTSSPTIGSGEITVQTQGWWPVVQVPGKSEEELFGSWTRISYDQASSTNPDGLVFGEIVLSAPAAPAPDPFPSPQKRATKDSCAIIVTGTTGAAGTYDSGVNGSADALITNLNNRGVPNSRIQNKRNANKNDIKNAVTAICNLDPPCDKIYVYIGSHGSNGSIVLGSDGSVSAEDLCKILEPLGKKGVPVCIMIESCQSGSLVAALRPKFPTGVIITSASTGNVCWGGTVQNPDGTPKGDYGFLSCALIRCWNDPMADTDGDNKVSWAEAFKWVCKPGNGKVRWGGREWDVKSKNPALTGLPVKTKYWQGPISGAWYTEIKRDTDNDGAYDQCDWGRDDDCDGILDVLYLEDDKDEDGKPECKVCIRDNDDDGNSDTRYKFQDTNDDGKAEDITCSNMVNGEWVQYAYAPRRSENQIAVVGGTGSGEGGEPFTIIGDGVFWENPFLEVFIGSHASDVHLVDPFQINGITNGYTPGPQNVLVVDFEPNSPSYGFDVLENGYTYTPVMTIDEVDPAMGDCQTTTAITIRGAFFERGVQVLVQDEEVDSAWVDSRTITAVVPPGRCGETVSITVVNPAHGDRTGWVRLEDAFTFHKTSDEEMPVLTCPETLILRAGRDGRAWLPPRFMAVASDNAQEVTVYRSQVGSLRPGLHMIAFEAVDMAGNRMICETMVEVVGQRKDLQFIPNRQKRQ